MVFYFLILLFEPLFPWFNNFRQNALQTYTVELHTVMEIFRTCSVQFGAHSPNVAISSLDVTSVTEKLTF